jgi:hypothetical protein
VTDAMVGRTIGMDNHLYKCSAYTTLSATMNNDAKQSDTCDGNSNKTTKHSYAEFGHSNAASTPSHTISAALTQKKLRNHTS